MPIKPLQNPNETELETAQSLERQSEPEPVKAGAPLTFVPHEADGAVKNEPVKIRTGRFGELEEHELIHLLDTIEDERARGRFRESIYISVFVWLAIAWVVFYGPRYLWHAPELVSPAEAFKKHELMTLTSPVLPRHATVAPKVDNNTLKKLKAMTPSRPAPAAPPAPAPAPAAAANTPPPPPPSPASTSPLPSAPAPARPAPPVVADAPRPQPTTKPNFSTPGSASDVMNSAVRGAARDRTGGSVGGDTGGGRTGKGASVGGGVEVLSDTQNVDFNDYIQRMRRDLLRNWIPLLPEETQSPLLKKGDTYIILTVLPDGRIGDMKLDGSSHDGAIDKAAWGSIISEGQFPPLPKEFHGPNLVLRWHYVVNGDIR